MGHADDVVAHPHMTIRTGLAQSHGGRGFGGLHRAPHQVGRSIHGQVHHQVPRAVVQVRRTEGEDHAVAQGRVAFEHRAQVLDERRGRRAAGDPQPNDRTGHTGSGEAVELQLMDGYAHLHTGQGQLLCRVDELAPD